MVYIVAVNNSAMLVFLMQAGFTMLEAGSVRERNVSLCREWRTLVFLSSAHRAFIRHTCTPHLHRVGLFLCR